MSATPLPREPTQKRRPSRLLSLKSKSGSWLTFRKSKDSWKSKNKSFCSRNRCNSSEWIKR